MLKDLSTKFEQFKGDIFTTKDVIETKIREADAVGDGNTVKALANELSLLQSGYEESLKSYQDEKYKTTVSILEGIASGGNIGYEYRNVAQPSPSGSGMYNPFNSTRTASEQFSTKETPKLLKNRLADLFGVSDEEKIDVKYGLPQDDMVALKTLRGDEKAIKDYLSKKYRQVVPIIIAGKPNFVVNTGGDNYTLTNPLGVNTKDVLAFTVTETIPMTAGILAGLGTAAVTAPSGGGAVVASSAASNTAYGAAGGIQDYVSSRLLGTPRSIIDIAKDRGTEATTGMVFDLGLSKAGSGIQKLLSKNLDTNQLANRLEDSAKLLRSKGVKVGDIPVSAYGGVDNLIYAQERFGAFPRSKEALVAAKSREVLADWQTKLVNKSSGANNQGYFNRLETEYKLLQDNLKKYEKSLQRRNPNIRIDSEGWLSNRINALRPTSQSKAMLGEQMEFTLKKAQELGSQRKNQAFDRVWKVADDNGVMVDPQTMFESIREVVRNSAFADNPKINELLVRLSNAPADAQAALPIRAQMQALESQGQAIPFELEKKALDLERFSKPFNAERARELIKDIQSRVPDNMVGTTEKDFISQQAAEAARKTLDKAMAAKVVAGDPNAGTVLDEWNQAKSIYEKEFLAFEKDVPSKLLKQKYGASQMDQGSMVDTVLSSPKSVEDTLGSLRNVGMTKEADALQKNLQNAYLEKIGLTSNRGFSVKKADFDSDMLKSLYGNSAPRIEAKLRDLNAMLEKSGVNVAKLEAADLDNLMSTLSIQEQRSAIKTLAKKAAEQEKLDSLMKSEMVQLALSGKHVDNDVFADVALDIGAGDAIKLSKGLSPADRKLLSDDMVGALFRRYGTETGDQTRKGFNLFNESKLLNDAKGWERGMPNQPAFLRNIDIITGSHDAVDTVLAGARVQAAFKPRVGGDQDVSARFLVNPKGVQAYLANLPASLKHRTTAAMHGAGMLRDILKFSQQNLGDAEYIAGLNTIIRTMVLTGTGRKALAEQSRNDPEFKDYVGGIIQAMAEEEDLRKQESSSPQR